MRIRRYLHLTLAAVLCLLAQCVSADASPWIPMKLIDGELYIETTFQGVTGYSLIDMFRSRHYVSAELLIADPGNTGEIRTEWKLRQAKPGATVVVDNLPLRIGGMETNLAQVVVSKSTPAQAQLMLGSGFSNRFIFQLDYANSRIRFLTRDSVDLNRRNKIQTRPGYVPRLPRVRVALDGKRRHWFILDHGEPFGISTERDIASSNGWLQANDPGTKVGLDPRSRVPIYEFNIPAISIGAVELENVPASAPVEGRLAVHQPGMPADGCTLENRCASPPAKGYLGYDVLRHFVVTIDFVSGQVHLAPAQ